MLTVRALKSGSDGNAYLVETDRVSLLLDAGVAANGLMRYFERLQSDRPPLAGVVLTHEHADHSHGAAAIARKFGVPIYATPGTVDRLALGDCEVVPIAAEHPFGFDGLAVTPFGVQHDGVEPVALMIEHEGVRVALATDLGTVEESTLEWLYQAELVIVEANHDLDRLWRGPYPMQLKRRIASPVGHLSNEQAAHCIARCAERGRARWVWLAHLSDVNNTQRRALNTVRSRVRGGPIQIGALRRKSPSLVWRSTEAYVQASLF